jgi:hypothetical protein
MNRGDESMKMIAMFMGTVPVAPAVSGALSTVAITLGCILALQAANAEPVYYFNAPVTSRAAFQADAPGPLSLESFENPFATSSTLSFPVGGPEAFVVTSGDVIVQSSFSRGVSDGSFALFISEGESLTFLFDHPINAFGLDVNDLNFADMSFADDLGNTNANVLLGDDGGPAGGVGFENLQFFGVMNVEGFQMVQLSFSEPSSLGNLYVDRLEFGSAIIPEPDSALLFGIGLALIAFGRRRGFYRRRLADSISE